MTTTNTTITGSDTTVSIDTACSVCVPTGRVEVSTCVRCGDGPLVSGELTSMDLQATAAIDPWLADGGWQLSGPVCRACIHEVTR